MAEDKRRGEIIRIQKKRNSFFMLDKGFLEDTRLSYKAKGILAYLLCKPDNWRVVVSDIVKRSKDGEDSVYAGLKELKTLGYYVKEPIRNDKGVITQWDSVIYEDPTESLENRSVYPLRDYPDLEKPDLAKPDLGKPDLAYPVLEKPDRNYIYINNNYLSNNDKQQTVDTKTDDVNPKTDVVVSAPVKKSARRTKTAPDVSCLSFIEELSDKDKISILKAADNDLEAIQAAYEMAKSQGGVKNLSGFIITMAGRIQKGEISPPVSVKRQTVNRFVNFEQRKIDFKELERLEQKLLFEDLERREQKALLEGAQE